MKFIGASEKGYFRNDQQDRFFVKPDGFAIFDGHGDEGELVAETAAEFFEKTWDDYDPNDRTQQFVDCNEYFHDVRGGSTVTMGQIITEDRGLAIVMHNLGDSPAYLLRAVDLRAQKIAVDHTTGNGDEATRMEAEGAPVFYADERYFTVGEDSYLMVSRALGDRAARGVLALPSIGQFDMPRDAVIVAGSDGAIAPQTYDWAVRLATDNSLNAASVAQEIVREAPFKTHDNATIIIGR